MDSAYFVKYPRTIEDLRNPHIANYEHSYEVAKTVTLAEIDYGNFITDMAADRQFLEDNANVCTEGEPMQCLLIRRSSKKDGILAIPDMPDYRAYVKLAAYVTDVE